MAGFSNVHVFCDPLLLTSTCLGSKSKRLLVHRPPAFAIQSWHVWHSWHFWQFLLPDSLLHIESRTIGENQGHETALLHIEHHVAVYFQIRLPPGPGMYRLRQAANVPHGGPQ